MVNITTKKYNSNSVIKKINESVVVVAPLTTIYRALSLLDKLKLNDHKHLSPLNLLYIRKYKFVYASETRKEVDL
jgi:hypothetical protein